MSIDGIRAVDKTAVYSADFAFVMSVVNGQRIGPRPMSIDAVALQIGSKMPLGVVKAYASVLAMSADTAPAAGTLAYAEGKTYRKTAASGSAGWAVFLDFIPGTQLASAAMSGGTENAVIATSASSVSAQPYQQLITVGPFAAANTGAVTIAINGETPRALVTNTGAAIEPGYLTEGMSTLVQIDSNGNYRLFSYGNASAIQAAVEAALAEFKFRYIGAFADDAAATAAGTPLTVGAEYWNSTTNTRRTWTGSAWDNTAIALNDGDVSTPKLADGATTTAKIGDQAVTDAKVKADAAIKASKLAYSLDETNPTDYPFRPVYQRLREKISVVDTGGKGTGAADDDTAAFNEAIAYANTKRLRQVFVPSHQPGAYWKITSSILIQKPIRIVGEHILNTIAQNSGFAGGQFLFNCDGVTLGEDLEHVEFENLTIRPYLGVGTRVRGIQFNRVASPVLRNVIIYAPDEGIRLTGNRGYHTRFDNVQVYGCPGAALNIIDFTGGGDHKWDLQVTSCTNGITQAANSIIDAVTLLGQFENCAQSIELLGDVSGWNMNGSRGESNGAASSSTFRFTPQTGKTQRGIKATGCMLHTDAAAYPFLMGGAGVVSGIDVSNNRLYNYTGALIRNNGNLGYGDVRNNFLAATPAVVSNGPISTLTLSNNHGNSGAVTA